MLYQNLDVNEDGHLTFAGFDIRFCVENYTLYVKEVNKL